VEIACSILVEMPHKSGGSGLTEAACGAAKISATADPKRYTA